jgi:cbb3-type cytochrome oxidase maturation protein
MKHLSYNLARSGLALGMLLVSLSVAGPAYAHDNLGGDEMSMAVTIFLAGMVTIVGAALAMWWAYRSGQFNNVEGPKYTMLENAPDLDNLPIEPESAGNYAPRAGGHHAPSR